MRGRVELEAQISVAESPGDTGAHLHIRRVERSENERAVRGEIDVSVFQTHPSARSH